MSESLGYSLAGALQLARKKGPLLRGMSVGHPGFVSALSRVCLACEAVAGKSEAGRWGPYTGVYVLGDPQDGFGFSVGFPLQHPKQGTLQKNRLTSLLLTSKHIKM